MEWWNCEMISIENLRKVLELLEMIVDDFALMMRVGASFEAH